MDSTQRCLLLEFQCAPYMATSVWYCNSSRLCLQPQSQKSESAQPAAESARPGCLLTACAQCRLAKCIVTLLSLYTFVLQPSVCAGLRLTQTFQTLCKGDTSHQDRLVANQPRTRVPAQRLSLRLHIKLGCCSVSSK